MKVSKQEANPSPSQDRICKLFSATVCGAQAHLVRVEVSVANCGQDSFDIVGLPAGSVKEGRQRIRSAIIHSNFRFPEGKITVNLAPADQQKDGCRLDLAIAIGILVASRQLAEHLVDQRLFTGELALDGEVQTGRGHLAIAHLCQKQCLNELIAPLADVAEVALANVSSRRAVNLRQTCKDLSNDQTLLDPTACRQNIVIHQPVSDWSKSLSYIKGQALAKRGLLLAASGFHSVLMSGEPGVGKSLLAKAFQEILPALHFQEVQEVGRVQTVTKGNQILVGRPFRSPHHSASMAALLGDAKGKRPGEMALAHRGVLFLDEFAEFRRDFLESLRQPLEDGHYHLSRAFGDFFYLARFMLLATMNPCPCGFRGSEEGVCRCSPLQVQRYRQRLSGPIMDRMAIVIHLQKPNADVEQDCVGISPSQMEDAIARQDKRYHCEPFYFNGEVPAQKIGEYIPLKVEQQELLRRIVEKKKWSIRVEHQLLRLARTVADLKQSEDIDSQHLAWAVQMRQKIY